MKIIDISPVISARLAVWPGDTPFSREVLFDTDQGDSLGLSKISTTLHLGAHTDAPNHYAARSDGIDRRSLNYYFGPCQVIEVKVDRGETIRPEHFEGITIRAPRVIFKTGTFPNPEKWNKDFSSLSVDLVDFLAAEKVLLVGIDTPSVDPFESKELPAHKAIHRHNMAILEGVVLDSVQPGPYYLSALPLSIQDADASPVRAVLIEGQMDQTQ